jgi:hypothetical protein
VPDGVIELAGGIFSAGVANAAAGVFSNGTAGLAAVVLSLLSGRVLLWSLGVQRQLRYIKYKVAKADQFRTWRRVSFAARVPTIGCKVGSRTMGP